MFAQEQECLPGKSWFTYERLGRGARSEFRTRNDGTFGLHAFDPQIGAERRRYLRGSIVMVAGRCAYRPRREA